jgi:hypothetical protein
MTSDNRTQQNATQGLQADSWIRSEDGISEIYANMSHITWTLDDVRIRLAQLVAHPEGLNPGREYKVVAEERAAVTFTWRAAVLLRDQLIMLIQSYEKTNGPIKVDVKLPPAPF